MVPVFSPLCVSPLLTCLSIFVMNKSINKIMKCYYNKLRKNKGIDVLNKNSLLTFGISRHQCDGHNLKQFDCGNLDCNYGRLSYVLSFINNSKITLDVCIYIITAKLFGDSIIAAYKRGVRVRVIGDSDMSYSAQSIINELRELDIPIMQRVSPYIMHHKFVIVDEEILINGSMNFTMTGAFCNWENVMITSQSDLVIPFQQAFDGLWGDFKSKNDHNSFDN